jgi:uncharacterized membrane protein YccC
MNRERFEYLLKAYGADFGRWPVDERAAAAAFAAAHSDEIAAALSEARALDAALSSSAEPTPDTALLAARILKARPQRRVFDQRAALALAACAVFGVMLGYGGGLFAPLADQDDGYFDMAFQAPEAATPGDEG